MPQGESTTPVYRALGFAVRRVIAPVLTRRHFSGHHHIPKQGPALVVANHIGNYDVLTLGDFLISAGRWPRFLGKADIWKVPGLRWLATGARQIPVERYTERAKDSLRHAQEALEAGDLVGIYPEGTITRDPEGWPMLGRHGAARLALATAVTVVPVAQHGAERVLGGRHLEFRKLFSPRRRDVFVAAGPPVDLSDIGTTDDPTDEQLVEATARIMQAITVLYAELRGGRVPELVWDPWREDYVER